LSSLSFSWFNGFETVARCKFTIRINQCVPIRNHLFDTVLLEFGFDEIDKLTRCHSVQLDPLGAQERDRLLTETGLPQTFVADFGIIWFRQQAVDVGY
jgi:hypothetical protein